MSCPVVIRVTTGTGPPGIGLPAGTADAGKFVRKAGSTPYVYELVVPDQVGLPQPLGTSSTPTFAGLTLGNFAPSVGNLLLVGTGGQLGSIGIGSGLAIVGGALTAAAGGGSGSVTSVGLTMPTGFAVGSSPVTGSGTLAVTFSAGYSLPTTASQANWDAAYSERLRWDGGATGLNAATARSSLGLGSAATAASSDFATAAQGALAATAVQPAALSSYQPLDSDLTSIAALTTTTFGRSLLTQADAATARTALGAGTVTGVTATGPITSSGGNAPVISTSMATGRLLGRSSAGTGVAEEITLGANLTLNGGVLAASVTGGGGGTVTSVDLSLPSSIFSVSGSPITTAGTISASLVAQSANLVLAGPSTGAAAAPTFRQLGYSELSGLPTLGGAAALNVGTTTGTVAAGDDSRITGALSAATAASTYQPLDSDLTSIAALSTTTYGRSLLTQVDAAATRTTLGLGTLATQSGTFSGTSSGTNTGDQTITLTGDVTGSGTGSFAATLSNTAVTAGSYGSGSQVGTFTVDAKGRLTAAANTSISIGSTAISDSTASGRSLLTAANAAAQRTALGLGTAATADTTAFATAAQGTDQRTPTDGSVTDAKVASGGLSASSINWVNIAAWATSTAYAKGDLVEYLGIAYRRSAAGTSGTSFNTANWQQVTPSDPPAHTQTASTISDSTTVGRAVLTAADAAAARAGLGLTALATATAAGGLSIQSGNLVPLEHVKLFVSNVGETGITTGNFKNEVRIDRAFTVVGVWWNCNPTAMGTASTSDARPYIRTSAGTTSAGTKTNLLTTTGNIASLTASVHTVDATASISGGTYSGSAGDWLGVDLQSVGTGSSGHFITFILRYS